VTPWLPEAAVAATAFVALGADLIGGRRAARAIVPLAIAGLAVTLAALAAIGPDAGEAFGGRFDAEPFGWWLRITLVCAAAAALALAQGAFQHGALDHPGEFVSLLLFNLCGMMILPGARDLASFYVALELATVPVFLLIAWRRDAHGAEAGLKMVVTAALASALLLYGLGVLYGLGGSVLFDSLGQSLPDRPATWLGAALVFAGIAFKLALAPAHLWVAEVYQGAPPHVAAWLAVGSKIAGVSALAVVCDRLLGRHAEAWTPVVAAAAALTMTVGNVAALVQSDVLRFMAFSSVAQAGNLILGLVDDGADARAALAFFATVYAATTLAAFAVIAAVRHQRGGSRIADFAGLSRDHPALAGLLMIALFGLAGIPPLGGFVGKFFLFTVPAGRGWHGLVAVAAVNATISLYAYLRIVRQMYIAPAPAGQRRIAVRGFEGASLALCSAAAVALGVVPWFWHAAHSQAAAYVAAIGR